MDADGDLSKPMIPPRHQRALNQGENFPDWALNINYRSKM